MAEEGTDTGMVALGTLHGDMRQGDMGCVGGTWVWAQALGTQG